MNDPSFLRDNPWLRELKKRGRDSTPVNNININNKELTPVNKNNKINNRGIYNINNINNKSLSDRRLSDKYNKNNIIIYNKELLLWKDLYITIYIIINEWKYERRSC